MKTIKIYRYDAFTSEPYKGNAAGVVIDAAHLSHQEMQDIAFQAGYSETVFVLKSNKADLQLRYFTPGKEVNLCGHATIAAVLALKEQGTLGKEDFLTIETKAGVLPIRIEKTPDGLFIEMKQATPKFKEFTGDRTALAASMGVKIEDFDTSLPIMFGNTGSWTLLVPMLGLMPFEKMEPKNEDFPGIFQQIPESSLHPFCLETTDPKCHMHSRHFSSPLTGIKEDPITGTASAVMGAYYAKYIAEDPVFPMQLQLEQGQEMGKDGRVAVRMDRQGDLIEVSISGTAVFTEEFEVNIR
ncbi:PhzF family phenazine biosynthesis protein [Falsibacillus pallidus]|uniref:PhzF family phenazine biosynthesis protein n=1 Tax=Falsibacillus pallidus TaxID=493781 RepID=UPI003D9660EB